MLASSVAGSVSSRRLPTSMIRPSPLVLRSLVVASALAALSGCPQKTEGALLLKLEVEPALRADCLLVQAREDGRVRASAMLARTTGKNDYFVGIARSDFPETMEWQATAHVGRCADESTWKLASRSAPVTKAFPATGVAEFTITVGQPDVTLDGDRDTYVGASQGGTDCNDDDAAINPGASQVCSSSVDTNCDGKLFCADPTCTNTAACTTPPTALAYETSLPTLVASDCSGPVVLQAVAGGLPAAVTAPTTVTLTPTGTAAPGLQLFTDPACATPAATSTVALPFGTSRVTFSFRAPTPGDLTLTASAPMLGSTALATTVTDRPVARLALAPTSLSARAGSCSAEVVVTALDDRMMPTRVPATGLPLVIGFLPLGTGSVTTFTDASCATAGTPSIAAGTSSTRLYLRGTRVTPPGMPIEVQVSSPTVNAGTPESLALTITAGDPQRIAFTASVLGLRNQACSQVMAEVELLDASGNVTTAGAGGVAVALTFVPPGSGGTLAFHAAPGCSAATTSITIAPGQSRAGVYLLAAGAGTYTVTATASALPGPATQLQVDVATRDPSALVFPTPGTPAVAGAGVCGPGVRLQTRETNSTSSPVSPVPANVLVTLSASPAGAATFFSDSSCLSPLTNGQLTLSAGSSEATFYFRGTVARAFTVGATATGLSATAPEQSARISAAPTSKLVFQPPTSVSALADGCSGGLGLLAFDAFDNPTFASGPITPQATPSLAPPAGVAFSTGATCATSAATVAMVDGGVTFYARAQRAQQYSISATGLASASVTPATFTVDAGAPSVLRVAAQPSPGLVAGACTEVQLERLDGFMNPSPGGAQSYTVTVNTSGVLSVHGDLASCSNGTAGPSLGFAAGATRSSFFVRGRLVGTSTLTATAGAAMAMTNAVAVTPGTAGRLRFASGSLPASSAVGVCVTATVERLDDEGNLTTLPAGLTATATASGAASGNGLVMASGAVCGSTAQNSVSLAFGSANSTTFSYSPRATGALAFDVTSPSLASAMGATTIAAGAVARVRFVMPPTMDQAYDACVPLTLEALDVGNNRVSTPTNVTFSTSTMGRFFTSSDCMSGMTTMMTVPASNTLSLRYQPRALGAVTLTAQPMMGMSDTAGFTVIAGAEVALVRSPSFATTTTAGDCVDFTVRRVDSGMNDAGGAQRTVTVTLSGAASMGPNEAQVFLGMGCGGAAQTNPALVDIMAGASSATFSVRPRKVGALTLDVASAPLTPPSSTATTVVAGALDALAFSTTPPASLAANACSPIVTVNGTDSQGNPAALGMQALSMTGATFYSDATCMTSIAQLSVGAATTASFYLRNDTPAASVALTVGGTPSAMQSWNIVAAPAPTALRWQGLPNTMTRFVCTATPFQVESIDGAMMSAPSTIQRPLSLAPATSTGFHYFTDSTCATAVTAGFGIDAGTALSPALYALSFANGSFSPVATDTSSTPLTATPAGMVTVSGGGVAALSVTPGTTDLQYRTCTPLTIRRTVGGTDFTVASTTVNLTVGGSPPAASYALHTMSDCSDVGAATLSGVVLGPNSATAVVYLRGRSAEPNGASVTNSAGTLRTMTVTATDTAGYFTAGTSAAIAIHPAVRRGTCTIQDSEQSSATSNVQCTVAPALPSGSARTTFFTAQAVTRAGNSAPDNVAVRCVLDAVASSIICNRVGTSEIVDISWQTVTMADAVVLSQSGTLTSAVGTQTVTLSEPVASMGAAFVLLSSGTNGSNFGIDDVATAELATTTTVELKSQTWPTTFNYSVQVVQLPGTVVERGSAAPGAPTGLSATAATSAPGASSAGFVLHSSRTSAGSGSEMCKFRFRSVPTSDTLLTFTRAQGSMDANCANATVGGIAWERPAVPNTLATVQSLPAVPIVSGQTSSPLQVIGTDTLALDRVWSFVSGQGFGGQCGGETESNSSVPGFTQGRIVYSRGGGNTRIVLSRGTNGGASSSFSLFALTFVQ